MFVGLFFLSAGTGSGPAGGRLALGTLSHRQAPRCLSKSLGCKHSALTSIKPVCRFSASFDYDTCPGGGIGRRAGFRCQWGQPRGGSNPLLGTKQLILLVFLFSSRAWSMRWRAWVPALSATGRRVTTDAYELTSVPSLQHLKCPSVGGADRHFFGFKAHRTLQAGRDRTVRIG